ncbi:MAG TPA: DUF6153 family protein [Kribbella sp.]|jgi:hypothetical protein
MSIQVTGRSWSGLTRALAVLGVLAGVFAMHGLTGNHDAAMADPHLGSASSAAGPAADHRMGPVDEMGSSSPVGPMGGLGEKAAVSSAATHVAFIPASDEHVMAGACVAVLTGLVLLLTLLLGLRSLLAWRPVQLTAPAVHPMLTERSPPWLVPSLSKLCVLRT